MSAHTKQRFRQALAAVAALPADAERAQVEVTAADLRAAFLAFGSETPDNLACMRHVELGRIDDGTSLARPCWGLRLAGSGAQLSDVLNVAEGSPVPEAVAVGHPGVSQEAWDALLRLATLIFIALEGQPTADA